MFAIKIRSLICNDFLDRATRVRRSSNYVTYCVVFDLIPEYQTQAKTAR